MALVPGVIPIYVFRFSVLCYAILTQLFLVDDLFMKRTIVLKGFYQLSYHLVIISYRL